MQRVLVNIGHRQMTLKVDFSYFVSVTLKKCPQSCWLLHDTQVVHAERGGHFPHEKWKQKWNFSFNSNVLMG